MINIEKELMKCKENIELMESNNIVEVSIIYDHNIAMCIIEEINRELGLTDFNISNE